MLPVGKLDSELLKKIVFDKITFRRNEVKSRAAIGEDCATVDFDESYLVISTDPITAAVEEIGRLAIHISCNDIATNGIEPIGIMLSVMLPVGTTQKDVERIMEQAGETAKKLEVEIVGGHTEITHAVNKPIIVSTAFGKKPICETEKFNAEPGDVIMMTKTAGLEGIGIIASDLEQRLTSILTKEELGKSKKFLESVSVVKEGIIAGKIGASQMHDITEGGILGAIWEMCQVGNLGAEICKEEIPVEDVTLKIANALDIDPYRLISSGCMLIISRKSSENLIKDAIENEGIKITKIGEIKNKEYGIRMNGEIILPPSGDELYKVVR